jgi:hypothetical protein
MLAIKKLKPAMTTGALLLALWPRALRSQSCCQDSQLELLRAQLMSAEFMKLQTEYRAWQNLERRNVPIYNARLNGAVIAFHRHITKDNHYLSTNCGFCRKYLEQIKLYSKKLVQAMK